MPTDRRRFLVAAASAPLLLAAKPAEPEQEEEVTPLEDLMREHGLIERLLLLYDEAARRLGTKEDPLPAQLGRAAEVVRSFVEGYHEKLEEEFLFARLEKANREAALARVLRAQHEAGRGLTARITALAKAGAADRPALAEALHAFTRMYRPHAAREDTVLFPAWRALVPAREYAALGEQFEEREHQLFGKAGFEGQLAVVAELEQAYGIADLARFTPPSTTPAAR